VNGKSERTEGEITDELKRLGRQLHSAAKAAWEGEERRELQAEIVSGLNALASEIEKALTELRHSPEGEVLKAKVHEMKSKAESGEVASEGRQTLLRVLRQINTELERLHTSWTPPEKAEGEKE